MNTESIIAFINENIEDISEYINKKFYNSKERIKQEILDQIKDFLENYSVHYEIVYDDCVFDFSGELQENGTINLEQTILEFLQNEYTGQKMATYESHYGWSFITFEDELSDFTFNIGLDILRDGVTEYLKEKLGIDENNKDIDFDFIYDYCDDFVYSHCLAENFFGAEFVVDNFLGISEIKLNQI